MASIQDNEEIGPAAQIRQIKLLASCWEDDLGETLSTAGS